MTTEEMKTYPTRIIKRWAKKYRELRKEVKTLRAENRRLKHHLDLVVLRDDNP